MAGDSEVLRQLHKIQRGVPDKDFLANLQTELKRKGRRQKSKGGFFSGAPFLGGKKTPKIKLEVARERVKSFNASFKARKVKQGKSEILEPGIMSVQEMKDFRGEIKESADMEEEGFAYRALEAIVKFVDLKNSGVISGKQDILLDCLKKLSLALMENGGLSMFHTTWFFSVYQDYLSHYRVFRPGEYERAANVGGSEAKKIVKKLLQVQYELPFYLQLIDSAKRDIKQLLRYSKDPYVKQSLHGQLGCSYQHIAKVFIDKIKAEQGTGSDQQYLNEVNIITSYALFFTRIPMMHKLVVNISKAIPNLGLETTLHKEKINLALKLIQLDLLVGKITSESSDLQKKKIFAATHATYKYCTNLITDNRLTAGSIVSDVHAFPFLKQAAILISYRRVLMYEKKTYKKMLESSMRFLKTVVDASESGGKHLLKAGEYVVTYQRNLEAVIAQVEADSGSD